jgi:hypothetical protein
LAPGVAEGVAAGASGAFPAGGAAGAQVSGIAPFAAGASAGDCAGLEENTVMTTSTAPASTTTIPASQPSSAGSDTGFRVGGGDGIDPPCF